MNKPHILLISKDKNQSIQIQNALSSQDYIIHNANNALVIQQVISNYDLSTIIVDTRIDNELDDVRIGEQIRQYTSGTPIIYIVYNIDQAFSDATAFTKPFSYITRPFYDMELITQVQLCVAQYKIALEQQEQQLIFKQINNFSMQITQLTTDGIFVNTKDFFKNEMKNRLCFFYLYNQQEHSFCVTSFNEITSKKEINTIDENNTYMLQCINDNQTYQYENNINAISDDFFEKKFLHKNETLFAAPLYHGDTILGGYALIGDSVKFTSSNINLLQLITLRLSSIITNAQTFEELIKSKQKFKDLIESAPQTITEIDLNGNILYANKNGYQLFGSKEKERKSLLDYASEKTQQKILAEINKVIKNKKSGPEDFLVHDNRGKEIYLRVYSNLMEEKGVPIGIRCLMVDVSNEKKASEKINKLSLVVEQNPNSIIITDKNGKIEYVNPKYLSVNNITDNNYINTFPNVLKQEYHDEQSYKQLWDTIKRGQQWNGEFYNKKNNGEHFWEYVNISPMTNIEDNEDISNYIITKEDITQRKLSEEKVFLEKEKLEITLNNITNAVIVIDTNGNIVLSNAMVATLLDCDPTSLYSKNVYDLFTIFETNKKSTAIEVLRNIIKNQTAFFSQTPTTITSFQGVKKIVDFKGSPFFDKDKNIIGVIIVCQDVTDKIRMQEEIFNSQKLESIGLLAGGIAHDFNNILTSILGNITLAKIYSNPQDKPFEILKEAEKACLKSKDLTQQLLTFSRGGNPIKKLSKIDSLVKESATFILRGSNIKCEFDFANNIYSLEMDEAQINQVINNLLINAKQAMNDTGIIKISIYNVDDISQIQNSHKLNPESKYICIDIKDSGIGISEENINKIFDPYFTTKQTGSGLGLAICYSIIKKHNGIINVKSELGKGTTFSIILPATETEQINEQEDTVNTNDKKLSILIMDDEESVRTITSKLLRLLGHNVDCAECGEQAIEMYKNSYMNNKKYDVVFMDLIVPGKLGGKEAIKILHEFDPNAKAIISSGYSTGEIMSNYQSYGFCGVLTKPYQIEEVQKILNEI